MFIYKKLKASDANTIAFEAHKEYNIDKDNTASLGVSLLDSSYSSASRDTYSLFDINNHKQYFQLDHLFYKDALFNYGNLIGGIDYNNQEKRLYDKATIISLSQKTFGSGVQKGTFLFNNTYKDDSLGNLYVKNDILSNYPQDKERVFYLAPVKGFKSVDLTRDPNTGEPIVNAATSYNDLKLDDSLYINPVEYISCSFARNTTLNCTEVDLTNGYIKAPNSNNYNFGNEDFTISFYSKVNDAGPKSYILAKSKTQTIVEYPESNLNGSLKNTHGSASLLQPKEVDAGKSFPFEIFVEGRKIHFNRADQDIESTHNSGTTSFAGNTLYHIACVKTGSELKIYLDGTLTGGTGTDTTDLCQNKADLFIGTDPTISSSKLDNTSNQSISQLMIWNRGLTATEIANVSESIDGSPYVGNIFYENGIATLTSPKVNDGTLTSLQDTTGVITLNSTPNDQGAGSSTLLRQSTFSGSLTFTSSRETLEGANISTAFNNLIFDSTYLSASLTGNKISLVSKPYALIDGYTINTIQSESSDVYNNYALLNPIVNAIPGGIGTGSGDRGTDGDSITTTEDISSAFEGVFLAENQTVTESINVLFISNSQELVTENFPSTDTQITDTVFAFGNTDFTGAGGGSYELINDGGEYISANSISRTILLVSGNNDNGGYFQGQLRRYGGGGLTNITNQNYNTVPFTADQNLDGSTPRFIPDGLSAGNAFETSTDSIDFTESTTVRVEATGSIINISGYSIDEGGPGFGAGAVFAARVKKNNAVAWQIGGQSIDIGTDTSVTIQNLIDNTDSAGFQNISVSAGDKLTLEVRLSTVNNNWTNAGTFAYDLSTIKLRIMGVAGSELSEGFKNKVTLQHTLGNIKPQSIYKYRLNGIRTRLASIQNTYPIEFWGANNTNLGLSKDINNDDVVVRVTVFQGNQRITSSLFPSSSGTTSQDFSFDHPTGTDTDDLRLFVYPGISSTFTPVFSGKTQGFALEDNFTVTELSGSNVVTLNENLSNHFTASENISSQIIFTDTSNFINSHYSTTNPANILGFVGNDSKKVLVDNTYFTTNSLTSTASLERGNFISGSASIDITGTKGLYKVENVILGTSTLNSEYGATQTAIGSEENPPLQKVRIQTKKNGALQDTKYINGNIVAQNAFQAEADKLDLGLLTNTDNISFEFTVVDSSNNIDKVIKNQGFNIQRIELSKLTSSNEVTQVNGDSFPTNLDALYFSSSHINVGDANIPFTTGQVTASIASISADAKTITLNDNLFITSSLANIPFQVSGAENGPFIISASLPITTQLIGSNKEYQLAESFTADPSPSQDPGANEGIASHFLAGNNIISSIFIDPPNTTIAPATIYRNFPPYDTLDQQYNFFVSGVASPLYPDGVMTSSAGIDYTCSFQLTYALSAISGSDISSGDTFTDGEFAPFTSYASNLLRLTSSHNDDPHFPNTPLYTQGKEDINIVERTSDGHIKVNQTLFITASSEATGSSNSSSFTPGAFTFTSENPIVATGVTPDMLGGTFEFQDLGTLETNTYQITAIDGNEITLENLDEGSDAIQTVNESNLDNTPQVTVNFSTIVANEFTIQYKNSHLIFENEFHCTVDEDEYNFSLNPTARKNKDINKGDLANFATGSNFKPYVTTVGLYNEAGELLVVGKLGQPVRMSDETDTTFVVRYDT